jgi:cell division protein FtsL
MPFERQAQTAQLGCGTLILIALIVLLFSNGGNRGGNLTLENDIQKLNTEIRELKTEIEGQRLDIRSLESKLDNLQKR